MGATAQKPIKSYNQIGFQTNFLSGLNRFDDAMAKHIPSYSRSYVPSIGVKYAYGVTIKEKFFMEINAGFSLGINALTENQFKKKEDFLSYVNFGYPIVEFSPLSLCLEAGVGVCFANVYYANHILGVDYVASYTSINSIFPISATLWFDGDKEAAKKNKFGVFLQYIPSISGKNSTKIAGLSTVVDAFSVKPSTLSLGLKYQF